MSAKDLEEDGSAAVQKPKAQIRFTEWNCPVCEANNPCEDGFKHRDELMCSYCGMLFRAETVTEERFRLIPI